MQFDWLVAAAVLVGLGLLVVLGRGSPVPPRLAGRREPVTVGEVRSLVARYLGAERSEALFDAFARERGRALDAGAVADTALLRHSEELLSGAIGAASARLVLARFLRIELPVGAARAVLEDASEAIEYNRDLMRTALDEVGQGIAVIDRELRLAVWNRRFETLLDLPAGAARIGAPLLDVFQLLAERGEFGEGAPESRARERLETFLSPGASHRGRFAAAGKILEIRTAAMPQSGFVTTFADVTDEVRAAEALARANETLELRVRERTEELERAAEALARAKAAADAANLDKTKFLAAAGHDILQPLNAARLYVAALTERDLAGEAARVATNAARSLEAVEDIIGTLLDISRLDAGALQSEIGAFRLADILAQLEVEFAPLARERSLDFRVLPSSLVVRSDRLLLRRLLQNLVSNALKYTPRGRVLVGARRKGDRAVVAVHDTGLGIAREQRSVIFREFRRLEEGARVARGLGLGLSIVERIARLLDHPIDVRSEPGRGSVFSVELPLGELVPAQEKPAAARRNALAGFPVVCIDNEADVLDAIVTLLAGWGCAVVAARDGTKAIEACRAAGVTPRGILADYHLDQGDGLGAIAALRDAFGADLPAALVTADRTPAARQAAGEAHAVVLAKPVKPAQLRALLGSWAGGGSRPGE